MTSNQERAALVLAEIEQYVDIRERRHILTAVLAAAEARGRAEVAAKVEALADAWEHDSGLADRRGTWVAAGIRALIAEGPS